MLESRLRFGLRIKFWLYFYLDYELDGIIWTGRMDLNYGVTDLNE